MITINDKYNCCGCSACASRCPKNCIVMKSDEEGFLYPVINTSSCINCGLCEKVCPITNQNPPKTYSNVYAAINNDLSIRLNSSSGGLFSVLAENTIQNKGVVIAARFDENWNVVHDVVENIDDLNCYRGSKYVQSDINGTYSIAEQYLKKSVKVLFCGTPCQIAGLHSFLMKDYPNLVSVEVVCHGTPSPLIWKNYINTFGLSSISNVSFRDKRYGWKQFSLVVKAQVAEEEKTILSESFTKNNYMNAFLHNLSLRPSCYHCAFRCNKSGADITLGDYWGISEKVMNDDDKGTSLVIVNSNKGKVALEDVDVSIVPSSYNDALRCNPCLETSVSTPSRRNDFFEYSKTDPSLNNVLDYVEVPKTSMAKRLFLFLYNLKKRIFK